ncbi:MAG: 30S ribosomal protein S20 [Planctomycetota bacterium]
MAHSLSARKRARQGLKRKMRNQTVNSRIKTDIKKLRLMLTATEGKDKLADKICESYKLIDQAASKGVIHKNKAARLKSRLTLAVNKVAKK